MNETKKQELHEKFNKWEEGFNKLTDTQKTYLMMRTALNFIKGEKPNDKRRNSGSNKED